MYYFLKTQKKLLFLTISLYFLSGLWLQAQHGKLSIINDSLGPRGKSQEATCFSFVDLRQKRTKKYPHFQTS